MFPLARSRFLSYTIPTELQYYLSSQHLRKKRQFHQQIPLVLHRKLMRGKDKSAASKKISEKEKNNKEQPMSLILQKLIESKKIKSGQDEDHTRRVSTSLQDLSLRLKRLSMGIEIGDESDQSLRVTDSDKEKPPVFEAKETLSEKFHDKFIEDVVLDRDILSMPKPSPLLGTEDQEVPPSKIPCVGCGALLQCQHRSVPGFMPSERFKLLSEPELKTSICQRCHYIQHCDAFVEVTSSPEDYAEIISQIKPTRSLVIMVVDVMDIQGSIVPNLSEYIGHKHPVIVVGNKVDLVAPDGPEYLKRVREALSASCKASGLKNIRQVKLISAKTGFGVERLINILLSYYEMKVDVYIVGTANAGKSSLFNILLGSDYCKQRARDLIQRATVSVWPGTTLNLLKFPIMRPTPRTLMLRQKRLKQETAMMKEMKRLDRERQKRKRGQEEETWELKEDVKTTDTRTAKEVEKDETDKPWGQEVFAYTLGKKGMTFASTVGQTETFDESTYAYSYWMYDTPGVVNPEQTFNLLEPEECEVLQPATTITPRCVLVQPGQAIFITGMARLDYVEGNEAMIITVHCCSNLPIKVVSLEEADQFYLQHIGTQELRIPLGSQERWSRLPSLEGQEFEVCGEDHMVAVADVQLSSVGWVSLAPRGGCLAKLRAYTPGGRGIALRSPALVPAFKAFMGKRIEKTPFFQTKPLGYRVKGKELVNEMEEM